MVGRGKEWRVFLALEATTCTSHFLGERPALLGWEALVPELSVPRLRASLLRPVWLQGVKEAAHL